MTSDGPDELRSVLERWTAAATQLTSGKPCEPSVQAIDEPPAEADEAIGLGPAGLTITIGLGPNIFGSLSSDRFGLARQRPAELGAARGRSQPMLMLLASASDAGRKSHASVFEPTVVGFPHGRLLGGPFRELACAGLMEPDELLASRWTKQMCHHVAHAALDRLAMADSSVDDCGCWRMVGAGSCVADRVCDCGALGRAGIAVTTTHR